MEHNAANFWGHEANKDKRRKNWKKKEDKEVRDSNVEVLLGCAKTNTIEYETVKVLFEINLWEFVLQKLYKRLVPNNPPDDREEIKEDGLAGEKDSRGTKCC